MMATAGPKLAPGTRPIELFALGAELEEALGVKVDVGTPDSLIEIGEAVKGVDKPAPQTATT